MKKWKSASSWFLFVSASALASFAGVALGEEAAAPAEQISSFVSDGSPVKFDENRASITPIKGWRVEPKSSGMGMSLVMKEVLAVDPSAPKDYSQPIFARNMTVMTINEASPIDEERAKSFQEDFLKMAAQSGSMPDLQFTSHKSFNYKGENDGLVFFTQHTSNGFVMMQMHVLVSGETKQYLVTYNDLANRFSEAAAYDAAWKAMTSITVSGEAPKRYVREAKLAGMIFGVLFFMIAPLAYARAASQRRIRKIAESLQDEWDSGKVSSDFDTSNVSMLDTTRVAGRFKKSSKRDHDLEVSDISSLDGDLMSSRKSKFVSSYS